MSQTTRIWPIPGGVHPEERKEQSLQLPLGDIALPDQLIFPLSQHIGAPADPIVKVGDKVLAGQKIAAAHGIFSAPVHASSSGVVTAIEERTLPHPSGMRGTCIIIATDGLDQHIDYQTCDDYLSLDHATLVEKIREAGITGMGGASFPTAVKLNPKANQPIDTLIINGTECEPYITADDILMQTRADDIIKGTQLLAHILNHPKRVVIGVEDNKPKAIAALRTAAKETSIEIASFPTKYPSGGEKQLIQILTGKEVPSGQIPASIGVVLQNVGTTVAAYEAIRFGRPLIERITTVVGEALDIQRNIRVRLGTPIAHILSEHGYHRDKNSRLIMGGPMMGFTLHDPQVPVVKASNCLLVPGPKELAAPAPALACIRCGLCAEACPVQLLPQQMYWYARAEDFDRLASHNIKDCIECGACSFVCPSNIPLVQYYRAAKGTMRQLEIDREKSDRSRQRFEFRQERIAKAEAEKEAKREARKQAAAEARKKLDSEGGASSQKTAPAPSKLKVLSPEEEKAKLQRAVSSATDRVAKIQQRLQEAEETQKDKLTAQLKQAEVRLQDAQNKLNSFVPAPTEATAEAAAATNDPVAAAIARAQAKMSMPADEKLKASIDSLTQRLAKAELKLAAAKADNADTVDALQSGVDKLKQKLDTAKQELQQLQPDSKPAAIDAQEQDAATAAIARAQARAAAQANMSPEEKLREQIAALEKRLDKANQRLAKAEADNDDNLEAFRAGVEKTSAKLAQARAELEGVH